MIEKEKKILKAAKILKNHCEKLNCRDCIIFKKLKEDCPLLMHR